MSCGVEPTDGQKVLDGIDFSIAEVHLLAMGTVTRSLASFFLNWARALASFTASGNFTSKDPLVDLVFKRKSDCKKSKK